MKLDMKVILFVVAFWPSFFAAGVPHHRHGIVKPSLKRPHQGLHWHHIPSKHRQFHQGKLTATVANTNLLNAELKEKNAEFLAQRHRADVLQVKVKHLEDQLKTEKEKEAALENKIDQARSALSSTDDDAHLRAHFAELKANSNHKLQHKNHLRRNKLHRWKMLRKRSQMNRKLGAKPAGDNVNGVAVTGAANVQAKGATMAVNLTALEKKLWDEDAKMKHLMQDGDTETDGSEIVVLKGAGPHGTPSQIAPSDGSHTKEVTRDESHRLPGGEGYSSSPFTDVATLTHSNTSSTIGASEATEFQALEGRLREESRKIDELAQDDADSDINSPMPNSNGDEHSGLGKHVHTRSSVPEADVADTWVHAAVAGAKPMPKSVAVSHAIGTQDGHTTTHAKASPSKGALHAMGNPLKSPKNTMSTNAKTNVVGKPSSEASDVPIKNNRKTDPEVVDFDSLEASLQNEEKRIDELDRDDTDVDNFEDRVPTEALNALETKLKHEGAMVHDLDKEAEVADEDDSSSQVMLD